MTIDADAVAKNPESDFMSNSPQRLCFVFDVPFERVYTSDIPHQKLVQGQVDISEGIIASTSLESLFSSVREQQELKSDEESTKALEWIVSQAPPIHPPAPVPVHPDI